MSNNPQNNIVINVAVAIIHYQQHYLLGFRSHTQHQGNRYEFIGGKIEEGETAKVALIREVKEEVGIDIANNTAVKLGRLYHDYGDKQVCLQVYDVGLTLAQYKQHQHSCLGLEGQALLWVEKTKLLADHYSLPAANQTILSWLQLPTQISITHSLEQFSAHQDAVATWFTYHQQRLPKDTWVYMRIQSEYSEDVVKRLMRSRPDISVILPHLFNSHSLVADNQVVATHLTHSQLMTWFNGHELSKNYNQGRQAALLSSMSLSELPLDYPIVISCHDASSIKAANQLAALRIQQKLSPVIGIFLSPVLATQTHPDSQPLGWKSWSILAELADMPVIGLGGLSPSSSKIAATYGANCIAGIRQFFQN